MYNVKAPKMLGANMKYKIEERRSIEAEKSWFKFEQRRLNSTLHDIIMSRLTAETQVTTSMSAYLRGVLMYNFI